MWEKMKKMSIVYIEHLCIIFTTYSKNHLNNDNKDRQTNKPRRTKMQTVIFEKVDKNVKPGI